MAAARRHPNEAFLGLDADASRMREASHRAARSSVAKGGLANAWFAVAAAEDIPPVLDGRVDTLMVTLPWGSLLRGLLDPEPWFGDVAARLLRAGGELRSLLSVTPRDGVGLGHLDEGALDALVARWAAVGWASLEARPATTADVAASGSSWAKRLGIPTRRPASMLRLSPPQARSSAA